MDNVAQENGTGIVEGEISSSSDKIAESVYNHLISSVCIDFASNMHHLLKTGQGESMLAAGLFENVAKSTASDLQQNTALEKSTAKIPKSATETASSTGVSLDVLGSLVQSRRQLYPELYGEKNPSEILNTLHQYAVDLPDGSHKTRSSWTTLKWSEGDGGGVDADAMDSDGGEDDDGAEKLSNNKKKKRKIGDENDDDDDEDYQLENDKDDGDDNDVVLKVEKASNDSSFKQENGTPQENVPSEISATDNAGTEGTMMDIWGNRPPKEPTGILCKCRLCGRLVSTSRFASHLDKCMGISTRPAASAAAKRG